MAARLIYRALLESKEKHGGDTASNHSTGNVLQPLCAQVRADL